MRALRHGFKRWTSINQVEAVADQLRVGLLGQTAFDRALLDAKECWLSGHCDDCQDIRRFSFENVNPGDPNWRDSLMFEACGLIKRWRLSPILFRSLPQPGGTVNFTEQTTARCCQFSARELHVDGISTGMISAQHFAHRHPQRSAGFPTDAETPIARCRARRLFNRKPAPEARTTLSCMLRLRRDRDHFAPLHPRCHRVTTHVC